MPKQNKLLRSKDRAVLIAKWINEIAENLFGGQTEDAKKEFKLMMYKSKAWDEVVTSDLLDIEKKLVHAVKFKEKDFGIEREVI